MSSGGPPRVRTSDVLDTRKLSSKSQKKVENPHESRSTEKLMVFRAEPRRVSSFSRCISAAASVSLNASCSSDASSDSSHSQLSAGGGDMQRSIEPTRRKNSMPKIGSIDAPGALMACDNSLVVKRRCGWITQNTDPCYADFHDEEWGAAVHDDKKLFELLSFSGALAELTWAAILSKRSMLREVFLDFDPVAVSKLNERKLALPTSLATSLLPELRLHSIIGNAREICKIAREFGSFDKYVWGFVNDKPIVGQFRQPRHVPAKTAKSEAMSKDMLRRGFRGVGPTAVYSFMQAAGLANDHLLTCFRHRECVLKAGGPTPLCSPCK